MPSMTGESAVDEVRESSRIRERVGAAIAENASFLGRRLRFEIEHRDVILRGTVRSYFHKQIAQESIRKVSGVAAVRNELEVIARREPAAAPGRPL